MSKMIKFNIIIIIIITIFYCITIPAEDSVILYEYSKNLSKNGIITYGGSILPIEGATDFLWMVILAIGNIIGIDQYISALVLTHASISILYLLLSKNGYKTISIFIGIICTPYFYSSISGFSTIIFSVIYALALYLAINKKNGLYITILLLCLFRPDGVVWGIGLIIYDASSIENKEQIIKKLKEIILQLILPGILYYTGRLIYFNEYFPLPFIVKSAGDRDWFIFFKNSIYMIAIAITPIIITCLFSKRKIELINTTIKIFIFPVIFYGALKLEQNIGNRFLSPMFFGGMIIFSSQKNYVKNIFILISVLISIKITTKTIVDIINSRKEQVYYISKELSTVRGTMLTTEAGRLAYYSEWKVEDSWGLNTPEYAHNLINRNIIINKRYDLIVAHCDISLLNNLNTEPYREIRSWNNQCIELTTAIKKGNYTIYLIPFLSNEKYENLLSKYSKNLIKKESHCRRYDIYALSNDFIYHKNIRKIFLEYEGLEYNIENINQFEILNDNLCVLK